MSSCFENESHCNNCIKRIYSSLGKKQTEALYDLCNYKTTAADEFWRDKISDEKYLPYIMMCRSEEFSDYVAKRLDDYIDRVLEGGMNYDDIINEGYFLIHTCLYKESDKLINVYRKIARNSSKLRKINICWSSSESISPSALPPFLYKRFLLELESGAETDFISMLTDTLILTASNAVKLDGEDESFTEKIEELYNDYPDCFASAGFFVSFLKDNTKAFDEFYEYTRDPICYPYIMWVLDGLEYEKNSYVQGSPTAFVGPDNKRVHFSFKLDKLDFRWYTFFTEKIIDDAENVTISDPYYAMSFCKKFSGQLYGLLNHNDKHVIDACSSYFRRAAVIAGNPADFAGLLACDVIKTTDDLTALCLDIAERICQGRQRYCYNVMFHFFKGFDNEAKLEAISKTVDYLKENENSERMQSQRNEFFNQAQLFKSGKNSIFE